MNIKKTISLISTICISAAVFSGCSIVMSAKLPLSRPPNGITQGKSQAEIDDIYGYPVAVGMSADGTEYIEQIQFIDGVHLGWKVFRICAHCICDDLTLFLWEFIGTPIEMMNSSYPEYIYYVIYDNQDKVIRSVSQDSDEGRRLAALPWSSPRLPPRATNRKPSVSRIPIARRTQCKTLSQQAIFDDAPPSATGKMAPAQTIQMLKKLRKDNAITEEQYKTMVLRAIERDNQ